MFDKIIPYLIVIAVLLGSSLIPIVVAKFAGVTNKPILVVIGTLLPIGIGAFFASAGSAMATAVSPTEALIKGACYGLVGGMISSTIGVYLLLR